MSVLVQKNDGQGRPGIGVFRVDLDSVFQGRSSGQMVLGADALLVKKEPQDRLEGRQGLGSLPLCGVAIERARTPCGSATVATTWSVISSCTSKMSASSRFRS